MESALNFARLKRLVPIETVLKARGLDHALKRQGSRLVGPCPVHRGDNPRAFVVDLTSNLWHCFTRCRGGGDVVELVRRLDRISYRQTARVLAGLIQTQRAPPVAAPFTNRRQPAPDFQPFTHRLTLKHDTAWLRQKSILPQTARRFEAGAYPARGFLDGCVAIRLHNAQGQALGYAGRRLDPARIAQYGKWLFPPRFPKRTILYGYHQLQGSDHVVVTECPWGVMRLHQLGIPAVALLGTEMSHPQFLSLRKIPRIALLLDGDTAGIRASQQIHQILSQESQAHIERLSLPRNLDPDDLTDAELAGIVQAFLT